MKSFGISINIYGVWTNYRSETSLSESMPRDHIHMALSELFIYYNAFDKIVDIAVNVTEYVQAEDTQGNELSFQVPEVTVYSWGDSDYEDFADFHKSILSEKEFKF